MKNFNNQVSILLSLFVCKKFGNSIKVTFSPHINENRPLIGDSTKSQSVNNEKVKS